MSICLYTVCFTLAGKDPATNGYCRMLLYWLLYITRNAGLSVADQVVVVVDSVTAEHLKSMLGEFARALPRVTMLVAPQPKTMKEGMMLKYTFFEYSQDILLYMDIDTFVLRPLRGFQRDKLTLHIEGEWSHPNYGSGGAGAGFSAGKWACGSRGIRDRLFSEVHRLAGRDTVAHYTVEQPYFNKAVRELESVWDTRLLAHPVVCGNLNGFQAEHCMILDLCGEPGDGVVHENKIVTVHVLLETLRARTG